MPRQRRSAAERREQIADEALRLIAAEGAARLTAAGLARAVGVSDAALFRHFASMEAIVDAAINRFGALLGASLASREEDPIARLREFFLHRLSLLRAHPEVMQLAFNERLADAAGATGAKRVQAIVGTSRAHVLRCLTEAHGRGLVRDDVGVEQLAWTVFGFMRGAASRGRGPSPDEVWEALMRMLGAGRPPALTRTTRRKT